MIVSSTVGSLQATCRRTGGRQGGIEGPARRGPLETRGSRRGSIPAAADRRRRRSRHRRHRRNRRRRCGLAGLGLVDREPTAVVFLVVEALDRRLGLGLGVHLDEAEALAAAGVTVLDDLGICTVPYWANQLFQVGRVTE